MVELSPQARDQELAGDRRHDGTRKGNWRAPVVAQVKPPYKTPCSAWIYICARW
jgi:hypothetical protein